MELDNIKDLWNKEEVSETPEISTEQQSEIHNPLQKIRRNMRVEFWCTVLTLLPFQVVIFLSIENFRLRTYVFTLVAVMLAVIIFYFKKFFLLYKDLGNMAINTKDSIKNLLHQFELNKQYYFSYYLAFAPALVCQMILMNEFKILATPLQNEPEIVRELTMSLIFIMGIAVGLFALYGIAKWWFQYFYGKYIDDVVLIDTQINGGNVDEVTKIEKRRKSRYSRSERFFISKMGKAGSYVNALLWLSFYTIIGFVIVVICSVALGYMAAHFSH